MELSENDLDVFITAAERFFSVTVADPVTTGEPSIQFGKAALEEYTGWIQVSGVARGVVCITAGPVALGAMLQALGESAQDSDLMADLIGELVGTVVMNAREHFGERLQVQTPRVFLAERVPELPESISFSIPLIWHGSELRLLIALEFSEE